MLDQAEKLRKLVEKNKKSDKEEYLNKENSKPIIITVTSGKGGVGKSNFVINVAICLQKMNKRVLVFDADMGMGNDDLLLGFLPKYSVYDIMFKGKTIKDVVIEGPFGLKLLPGGSGIPKLSNTCESQRSNFIEQLSKLRDVDYIIMDTGAGINKIVLGFINCCDELIVITTPEPTSLMDAYSLVKAVNYFKIKNSADVIINKVSSKRDGIKTFERFNMAVNKFLNINLNYLGCISEDKKLIQAVKDQVPFVMNYPISNVSRDVNFIAGKIAGVQYSKEQNGIQELFTKIFNIFS